MSRLAGFATRASARRAYSSTSRSTKVKVQRGVQNFNANEPALFPNDFADIPAIVKWFHCASDNSKLPKLNATYLEQFGASYVPLELTQTDSNGTTTFERFEAPLSLLLAHMTGPLTPQTRLYLAQHSLADLPSALQADLPIPTLLKQLGRGDIYASSLWMGRPPTRTPLHRDPNPNLFVQLAGRKVVRLLKPDIGRAVYERVLRNLGEAGGRPNMRGDKMMQGAELEAMEIAIWNDVAEGGEEDVEAVLEAGDGLYVPLGWWHAVRGVGDGVGANASVNWWFR
ncbi:hypothetical protein FB567DRAFT_586707 [Paraphoma chrysanthemicola]|uniref:JmjC domain-containing protein n=1 Tax=Paraphoma chrysanthemicola TaxID=798071 RepID=A0A8K0RL64_9PLEO|nr:hypothetical protein FB567DRAFT_586707 [Paraphoma chrysanthemicola]